VTITTTTAAPAEEPELTFFADSMRHLVCTPYSLQNLHRMAEILDIKLCWFHRGSYPHYDIPKRRVKEILSKVNVVSGREILRVCQGEQITEGKLR
jgi:hypothetical protein